jgi:hypothetical protein
VGGGADAGHHRLVPDVVVDEVAFAAAFTLRNTGGIPDLTIRATTNNGDITARSL